MAVAGYVFDRGTLPPELGRAWDYQQYGVDLMSLPAGDLSAVRLAGNTHRALQGYKSAAGKTVAWSKANPTAWEFVSSVLMRRREERLAQREQA